MGFPQYGFKLRHHAVRSGAFRHPAPRLSLIPDIPADRGAFAPAFETRVRLPGAPPLCADLWRCSPHLSPEVLAPEGFCCPFLPRLATSSAGLKTSVSLPSFAGYRNGLWHSRILLPGLHTFRTFTAVLSRIAVCSFRRESGTCTPPFFRTSTGHRVEGRNPWQLQCSHNQLRVGTQFRRLVRSLSLRPSWLLASWADQTEPRLRLPKAFTSGLPALKSPQGLPDMTTAPNGELRRQDFHLQVQQLVSLRSLPWVPGTSVPHLPDQEPRAPGHRYSGPLRLPRAHLGGVRCSLSFPDTL